MIEASRIGAYLGGFVAGEGCFTTCRDQGHRTFTFSVGLGAIDRVSCELFREVLRVGSVRWQSRRKPHYDDEVTYSVRKLRDLVEVIVPFMDEHLPPSYKREQYIDWRAQLLHYWEHEARRRRACTVDGCDQPQRAKGLCRHHYFVRYRR